MRKIFTLLAAVFASFSLWAASSEKFPTTITPLDVANVATSGEYVFTCSSVNITTEANQASGWIGWNSTQSAFKEYDKGGSAVCMGAQTSIPNLKYDKISFFVTHCSGFSFQAWGNGDNRHVNYSYAEYNAGAVGTAITGSFTALNNKDCAHSDTIQLDATKTYVLTASNDANEEIGITYLVLLPTGCTPPATALTLQASKTADILVGDVITFSTQGGNGAAVKYFDGESEITSPWTATSGSHSITAVQADNDGVCGATTAALALNVISNEPVTSATISADKDTVLVGQNVILSCVAENADAFQWYNGGAAISGATEATYTFTAEAVGDYAFYCTASNAYTAQPVQSNTLTVNVTNLCGELIKATTQQVVTGLVGGTVATNLSKGDSKKLDKNKYFGIQLAGGATFAEGDIFVMNITAAAGSAESMGTMKIYADNAGTQKLYESTDVGVVGENSWELPAAVAGKTALFVYRGGGNDWNPTFSYISVTRDCSTEPKLAVSPASVNLKATTAEPADTAVVTFSGKRLTPGTYNLTIPNLAGLTVAPQSVTVGEDGKLNAEVTIVFASTVDVAAGVANIALTIGELNATVAVNYVAKMTKQYVKSLNIEQLVLDRGKGANIRTILDSVNIDYENIDALDSLDITKDYNNYPFLGLKLKKTDASLSFWLRQGSKANLKFGNIGANFNVLVGDSVIPVTTDSANIQASDSNVVSCGPVAEDTHVSIVCGSTKTLVIKQIMVDADIQPVNVAPGKDPTKDDDATIKSLTINGDTITPQGATYAYEVPAALSLAEVEVVYVLNSAKATGNPASGFKVAVPAAGAAANVQTLVVTAENDSTKEYTISVTHAEPNIVTAAEIQGDTNAYVSEEQTLTCVAEYATTYQWYLGANAISGATQATYKFTPDTAGEYTFACEASNEFTATPVRSADFTVTATVRPPQPEVLVKWDAVEANRIGVITYGASGVEEGDVKIHTNKDNIKGIKLSSSYSYADGKYVTFKPAEGGFEEGDTVFVAVCYNNSSEKNAIVALYGADGAESLFTSQNGVNGKSSADDPVVETYVLQDDADSLFIGRSGNTSTFITVLKVIRPIEVIGNPVLKVSKDTVDLFATLAHANPSAKVTFTGKHLTPGTYNLTIPNLAGLTVTPQSVTVPENGKLNAEVTIAYNSSVDVAAGVANISLSINELNAQVAVNYAAKMTKQYATSLNFEQLVLDQGKGADINAILASHNIDYNNIDALDSLNGSKDYNNYPFLGLKLKKEDASLSFWLRQGSKVNLKFGNIGASFNVYFGDGAMPVTADMANMQVSDSNVVSCDPVAADTYVSIVCGSTKTIVIKQIMIDEDIQPVNVDPGEDPTKDGDATIKSLSINGVAITREGTTYAYEVPADVNLAEVEVVYELNSAKATGNPASGFKVAVPAAGAAANEQTLTVTAESGAQVEYTISVTRAESQGLFDLDATTPAAKILRNGQLLIIKNNRTYTVLGQAL